MASHYKLATKDIAIHVKDLSCGPNTFAITVEKYLKPPVQLQVKMIQDRGSDQLFQMGCIEQPSMNTPVTVKKTGCFSWTASCIIRDRGQMTITVSVNGVVATPFVHQVGLKLLAIGTRVCRDPDGGTGDVGTVIEHTTRGTPLKIRWDCGTTSLHSLGSIHPVRE